jgi:RNA polymerase sigma factor (sigma-70 family)
LTSDDQREFDEFYRDTHVMLHRKAARLTQGHQQQAEDLVAETYLRAWRKWDELRDFSDPRHRRGWAVNTLAHVMQEHWRTQSRRLAPQPLPDTHNDDDPADCEAGVPELAAMRAAYATVREACQRLLRGSLYEVFIMRLLGFEHKEIADIRGTDPGTARKQVANALKILREDPGIADVLAQLREGGP